MNRMIAGLMLAGLMAGALAGCGKRTIRLDFVPSDQKLEEHTIETADAGILTGDKIAMLTVSGMIANMKASSLLTQGANPVSDFRQTLDEVAKDPAVKAVVLRINSPGGTVTASSMMYHDVLNFKKKTGKPVVVCMMDLCASGGYYLSCAADYRIAYPTTITGSIGVIVETININGTLKKIGVATESVKSGPNKDMMSPFKLPADPDAPLSERDRELMQALVNQFYEGFKNVVKESPQHIAEKDWATVTDGRVVSGVDAVKYGLIDEVGDLDRAIAKAKELSHIQKARIVVYTREDDVKGSIYASGPDKNAQPQVNMLNLNLDLGGLVPSGRSQFLYLWQGFGGEE
jgi:protease-4